MTRRAFGMGTLSLPLVVLSIVWSFTLFGVCAGDNILNMLGLRAWSNGDSGIHFTVYYSLVFFVSAFFLGTKYKNDFGAKTGRVISAIIGGFLIVSTLFLAL